jgi:Holliday junction resolvase-like predicted endonuclease
MERHSAIKTVGQLGESIAARFLEARGCHVEVRNVHVDGDEIDLIIRSDDRLIAVEVKCSTNNDDPVDAFDDTKHDRVSRAINGYRRPIARLDLVAVSISNRMLSIRWLQNVG